MIFFRRPKGAWDLACASLLLALMVAVGGARADVLPPSNVERAAALAPTEPLSIATKSGSVSFAVEVVQTDEAREQGLMYRRELAPDGGMLFLFERPQRLAFWMKNTYIPLDLLFIKPTGEIVAIVENTTPMSTKIISPFVRAQAVLEVKAGTAKARGIAVGDVVNHAAFTSLPR